MSLSNGEYAVVTRADFLSSFKSSDNKEYLIEQITSISDGRLSRQDTLVEINKIMSAWEQLGKFDSIPEYINSSHLINQYNYSLLNIFRNKNNLEAIPFTLTQVPSDLDGKFVQQDQMRDYSQFVKPVPFYERALYKRHYASGSDDSITESRSLFYTLDTDNMSEGSHRYASKVNDYQQTNYDFLEREVPVWRLN